MAPGVPSTCIPKAVLCRTDALSEDRMTQLMEMKVRLAESVKDSTCGQFFWLYTSHDNPGRVQSGEGHRELDRIGPVNYKGLLTPLGRTPGCVLYVPRQLCAKGNIAHGVYCFAYLARPVDNTRQKKDGIVVYSNCDEVELFNDVQGVSLGKRKRSGIGTHFKWDGVDIKYNVLYAAGICKWKKSGNGCNCIEPFTAIAQF